MESEKKRAPRPIIERVLTCVRQSWIKCGDRLSYTGCTSMELAVKLHITLQQVYRAVSTLAKRGELVRQGRGYYNIPLTKEQEQTLSDFVEGVYHRLKAAATLNSIEDSFAVPDVECFLRGARGESL